MAFTPPPRLYFAYGSSLSISEMKSQCPTSTFYSIAILRNHRWVVNERGYANIVPFLPGPSGTEEVVWGILYTLRPFDEELLDKHEGIPWAYSKADMDVEAVSISEDGRGTRREVVRALVYIDRERVQESYAYPDFVIKMNRGIQEAVERGLPRTWVDRVVRVFIADPSTVTETEGQVEAVETSPVNNGARPPSATRPESDQASQTREGLVRAPSLNGGSQKEFTSHIGPPQGLEKSKYARVGMSDAQQGKAVKERPAGTSQNKGGAIRPPGHGSKLMTCWWWKVRHSCHFSDEECQYAHYDTDVIANEPGKKPKSGPYQPEKKKMPFHPKDVSRRERSPSFKPYAGTENREHPYGYKQDWSAKQRKAGPDSSRNGPEGKVEPDSSWSAGQGKVEADSSWSEQVENLMDSEPEWLVANDRKDVRW